MLYLPAVCVGDSHWSGKYNWTNTSGTMYHELPFFLLTLLLQTKVGCFLMRNTQKSSSRTSLSKFVFGRVVESNFVIRYGISLSKPKDPQADPWWACIRSTFLYRNNFLFVFQRPGVWSPPMVKEAWRGSFTI